MKEKVLRTLLQYPEGVEYAGVWRPGTKTYSQPMRYESEFQNKVYFDWAGMKVHYDGNTDTVVVLCDGKVWTERTIQE